MSNKDDANEKDRDEKVAADAVSGDQATSPQATKASSKVLAPREDDDDDHDEIGEAANAGELPPGHGDERRAPGPGGDDSELFGLLAEFDTPGALIAAAEKVRDAGYTKWDCYSPFPVHGIDPAMGIRRTILPWVVFIIGLGGLGGGLLLQWWANAWEWPWIVSGKPYFSLPANIPITFETTVLASVFAAFFGMWGLNKLPQHWHPFFKKDRFRRVTDDKFFIGIEATDKVFQRGRAQALLEGAGAVAIETCYVSQDPARWTVPRPVMGFIIVSSVAALVPFAMVAKARATHTSEPRVHLLSDMDFQPRASAQNASDIFANGRASRMPPAGTVARGDLDADDHFYRGLQDGEWARAFPPDFDVSTRTMERGRQRFGIYCQPCHGAAGDGNGMVHKRTLSLGRNVRGWVQPSNLHQESIIRQPHGQIFNTITHGIRTMPAYAPQISTEDRWAIVLYLRALQRSQNASIDDLPADQRNAIR
ncbi:MAG TPA: quinol:electron acceptor oxidoreductase subunit ActD [Haliangium sp.]|nr:quinol:electron acceptor oxidoreductase subunit ActD [Haliangium sp.]